MLDYHLPLLSLRLLIENAVKHNIISERRPLLITVENHGTTLIVRNNLQKKASIVESTKIDYKISSTGTNLLVPRK
jgi:sensor histidine kinase YesM